MSKKMKAAVLSEVGKIVIEEREIPEIKENEVLVKIKHVGICGSDLHYYEHGRIGDFIVKNPIVLGHECAGDIVAIGEGVAGFNIGDRVALEPGRTCGKCEYCKTGRYNLCPDVVFMATPPHDGAFTEYVAYPADMAFKLPQGVSTLEGALIEPLAVGFHAANQGNAQIGQTAVIIGSGCIGLVTLLALRAQGITRVFVADMIPKRLEKAKELGAAEVFKVDEVNLKDAVMEKTAGLGVDLVIETAGNNKATQQTVELVKRGGKIVLVGMAPEAVIPYDLGQLISKEASIHTVFRYRNLYPAAISAVAEGLIPIKRIATDMFKFEDIKEAMKYASENKGSVVKGVIEF